MKRVLTILAVATLFVMNSNAQTVLRDTLFTQCISCTDTVVQVSINGVRQDVTWTSVGGTMATCSSCDTVVVYPNSPTSTLIGTFSVSSTQFTVYVYVVNYGTLNINPIDTTGNCNVEFATDVTGTFLGRWSGLNGYVVNNGHYLVNSGSGSGYIYAEAICGIKLDSAYYHDCSTDTTPVTTGIEDVATENVSVYPNPFTDSFTISPQMPYQLFDLLGREVTLNADLPKGSYILKTKTFNKVVVKQ